MSYHGHNQHGQFPSPAATRPFAQHPQQTNSNQIAGLGQQHSAQQQHQQQYANHLQHHAPGNSNFGLSPLTASSYKLDNSGRDGRQSNGLQGYSNMSSGNWSSATEMAGFGQAHSGGQLSHMLAQPHHSASQPSLSLSQYSQPQQQQQQQAQPQQQAQQQQHPQQQQQQTFLFPTHNQSPTHLRAQQQQQPQHAQKPQQQRVQLGSANSFNMTNMQNLRNAYGTDDEVQAANRYQAQRAGNTPVTPGRLAHDMRPGQGSHVLNNNPTTLSQNQPLSPYDQRTATPAMSLKGDVMLGGAGVAGSGAQHQQPSRHLNPALSQSPYSYHSAQQSPQQPYPSPHASILPQPQHQHPHQQSTPPGQSALTPKESPQLPAPKIELEPKKKQAKAPKAAAGAKKAVQGKKGLKAHLENVPSPEAGRSDQGPSHAMASTYNNMDSSMVNHNRMYSNSLTPASLAQHQQQYPSFQQQQQQQQHQPSPPHLLQNTLQQHPQQQQHHAQQHHPQQAHSQQQQVHQQQQQVHQQQHQQHQPQHQQSQQHQQAQAQQQALRHQRNESFEAVPKAAAIQPVPPPPPPPAPAPAPMPEVIPEKPKKGRGRKKKVVEEAPAPAPPPPAPAPEPPVATPMARNNVMPALPQTSSKLSKQQQLAQQRQQQQQQQQQLHHHQQQQLQQQMQIQQMQLQQQQQQQQQQQHQQHMQRQQARRCPCRPKRPPNAFLVFSSVRRPELQKLYPTHKTAALSKRLGEEWRDMSAERKSLYTSRAKDIKDTFQANHPEYVYTRRSSKKRPAGDAEGSSKKFKGSEGYDDGAGSYAAANTGLDPNRPRRPMNSYLIFNQEMRHKLLLENANLTVSEISRAIGQRWANMTADMKREYTEKAATIKANFLKENPDYVYSRRSKAEIAASGAARRRGAVLPAAPAAPVAPVGKQTGGARAGANAPAAGSSSSAVNNASNNSNNNNSHSINNGNSGNSNSNGSNNANNNHGSSSNNISGSSNNNNNANNANNANNRTNGAPAVSAVTNDVAINGKDIKIRGKKKLKDPDAPKHPIPGFLFFRSGERARIRQMNPNQPIPSVAAKMWNEMTPAQRAPWLEKAAQDKLRYAEEMQEYSAKKGRQGKGRS
ncbi:hypothetical protein BGZ70_009490 [Mortierella alpina]|uniref:HMG box domain-containing protein n=1 Tax=Mortierella alpina TaxID=64518 RepID=A0A9P6LZP8_MORAP|nr:hypothetical protein BGZ70_009490 [Mortierella alpina]